MDDLADDDPGPVSGEDLGEVLDLPDLPFLDGEEDFTLSSASLAPAAGRGSAVDRRRFDDRRRYRAWLAAARVFAAHGVRPGPSHQRSPDGGVHASWGAGFADVPDLTEASGRSHLPSVVLGFHVRSADDVVHLPPLPSGYVWRALVHQNAGLSCRQFRMVGVLLDPNLSNLGPLVEIAMFADRDGHRCLGISGLGLSQLVEYHSLLAGHGLTAEYSHQHLAEAVYPVDATAAALGLLTSGPAPSGEEFATAASREFEGAEQVPGPGILRRTTLRRAWGSPATLFVLGENCD